MMLDKRTNVWHFRCFLLPFLTLTQQNQPKVNEMLQADRSA